MSGLLTDREIEELCQGEKPMLSPFSAQKVSTDEHGRRILSYGLQPTGYDVTLCETFKIPQLTIDPLNAREDMFEKMDAEDMSIYGSYGKGTFLPGGCYLLGATREYFRMPSDVLGVVFGKSTLLRSGIHTPISIVEPGWEGHLVIEIANNHRAGVLVYANMGVAQVIFFRTDRVPRDVYNGKYQGQMGVTIAR